MGFTMCEPKPVDRQFSVNQMTSDRKGLAITVMASAVLTKKFLTRLYQEPISNVSRNITFNSVSDTL